MKKTAEEENQALIGPLAKMSFFDLDKNAKYSDKEQQGQERAEPECQHPRALVISPLLSWFPLLWPFSRGTECV